MNVLGHFDIIIKLLFLSDLYYNFVSFRNNNTAISKAFKNLCMYLRTNIQEH